MLQNGNQDIRKDDEDQEKKKKLKTREEERTDKRKKELTYERSTLTSQLNSAVWIFLMRSTYQL